ncbi:Protein of unknown function [Raineyella antarctica]|uniref:ATP-binding protein n=1 Tax=Raineyella antarctica TaxID=1577474 RepID=A0A1G6GVS4_9ACTN|nr:DUF3107 domain-containing protein [Raineyella antarctica]SDB85963.1 Protein of unknown function [Raineyella antarctica]
MEIKIGVKNLPREVVVELDQTSEQVTDTFRTALADGTVLTFTDTHGRQYIFPADGVAYIEIGQQNARPVGFGSL